MMLYVGLMSGTSMDGIDAALLDVTTNTLIAGITRPYSDQAKQLLLSVLNQVAVPPSLLCQLNTVLGREFASAVLQLLEVSNTSIHDVVSIGSHGQTICHDASAEIPYTLQLGCAHTIAELTGKAVVADFRTRDIVIGGQGAPFAPIYHETLFSEENLPLALVNIGGIANVTYLEPGHGSSSGYDVGPGNCLMDSWIYQHKGLAYDRNGAWALTGNVIEPLLTALLDDPYFKRPYPKSLGKEYFSPAWLSACLRRDDDPGDVQATLVQFTAITIANDIKKWRSPVKHLAICGGGAHNIALMRALSEQLPQIKVDSTSAFGVDPDFIEAMMFAWLAEKTINQKPVDLRHITGAKKASVLGVIYTSP